MIEWNKVDWNLSNSSLAETLRVAPETVSRQRARRSPKTLMRMKKGISPSLWKKLEMDYQAGLAFKEIAKRYGYSSAQSLNKAISIRRSAGLWNTPKRK